MKNFLRFSLIFIWAAAGFAQSPKEQLEALWLNVPSSPLQFHAALNGRGYQIENWSTGHVVKYQLGCVAANNGKTKLLNKRAPEAVSLEPRTESAVSFTGAVVNHGVARPEPCRSGRLSFIEVWFQDGGVWRSPQLASK